MTKKGILLLVLSGVLVLISCGREEKQTRLVIEDEQESAQETTLETAKEYLVEKEELAELNSPQSSVENVTVQVEESEKEENDPEQENDSVETVTSENDEAENEKLQEKEVPDDSTVDVNSELKAFLDEYEAFMDEYVGFMKKYKDSGNSTAMLYDYLNMMERYADFAQTAEEYNSNEMSAVDAAYYIEVTSRVSKKMLEAAY